MKNLKIIFLFVSIFCFTLTSFSQLNPGDIMIVGFMGDGDGTPVPSPSGPPNANCGDGFSFLCLVDIPANEQVIFTEEEFLPSGFQNGDEGHIIWTNNTGATITSGTVIQVTTHGQMETTMGCGAMTSTAGSVVFGDDGIHNTLALDNWALSSSNEEIYVYQGTPGNPTHWISAFFTDDLGRDSFVPGVLMGLYPNLRSLAADVDVAVYTGETNCSDPVTCQAAIVNTANWSYDDGPGFQCCDDPNTIEYPRDVPALFEGLLCQPPVIFCPADVTVSCDVSTDPANMGEPTFSDGCGGVNLTYTDVTSSGESSQETIITRTWTATDEDGQAVSCAQIIRVIDDVAPVPPAAPADLILACAENVPAPIDLTATDNCSADITVSPTATITPGACTNDFTMVRTWTFVDDAGNTSSVSQHIEVSDELPPVAPVPPPDLFLQCADDVPSPVDLTATDNCAGAITVSPTSQIIPGACVNEFAMVRTWTFTDDCGNTSSVNQTITVLDDVAPVSPMAPADLVLQCADDVPPPVDLTATDNCAGAITVSPTSQIMPGSCVNEFAMVRTWTFTDDCGNTSSVSQTITVLDDVAPVSPTAPADLVLQCADDVPPPVDLTATDNCAGSITVSPTSQIIPGACVNEFTMVRTWTFTDDCGNSSAINQVIKVEDNTTPSVTGMPVDGILEIGTDPGQCGAQVDLSFLGTTDNCGQPASLTVNPAPGFYPTGSTTFSIIATDECGNTSTETLVVNIMDSETPVALCKDIDVNLDIFGNASITTSDIDLGSFDNCGLASLTIDRSSFNCLDIGPNPVTLTVTDLEGNIAQCVATVNVIGVDADEDGVCDIIDNCPLIYNPDQNDTDLDGFGAACDCNDLDPAINPAADEPPGLGIDSNCDGLFTWYEDADLDSYGSSNLVTSSNGSPGDGESANNLDCDDTDADQFPGQTWYEDADGDGFGNPEVFISQCLQPTGYVVDNTDTDDTNPFINPNNAAPIAYAGMDQSVLEGEQAQLDGSGSSDPDGDLITYLWNITSAPVGSAAYLFGSVTANPVLYTDIAGEYVVSLVVNDGLVDSGPDEVIITAQTREEVIEEVIDELQEGDIVAGGEQNSLVSKLDGALDKLEKGNEKAANNQLKSFIKQVEALIRSGRISQEEGDALIAAAQAVIDQGNSNGRLGTEVLLSDEVDLDINTYPNPFDQYLQIDFRFIEDIRLVIDVYNLSGVKVAAIFDNMVEADRSYSIQYEPNHKLNSGLYLMRITRDGVSETRMLNYRRQ